MEKHYTCTLVIIPLHEDQAIDKTIVQLSSCKSEDQSVSFRRATYWPRLQRTHYQWLGRLSWEKEWYLYICVAVPCGN